MTAYFQFEADFVQSLRCIPMQVRLKLDTCGIKLKLPQWHQFTHQERETLVELPCTTPNEIQAYREFLNQIILKHTGTSATDLPVETNPAWLDEEVVPISVLEQAQAIGVVVTPEQWTALTPVQRFALIKLSRSDHENNNFFPAIKEFHLVE